MSQHLGFNFTTPWIKLDPKVREILLFGTGDQQFKMQYKSHRWSGTYKGGWECTIPNLMRMYTHTKSGGTRELIEQYMSMRKCPDCKGARLKKESLAVQVGGFNIGQISSLSIKQIQSFFKSINLTSTQNDIASQILKEIEQRLDFLVNVGLDYLSLDRSASTLSGGESQRIRLATQIGSQLMGVLYILDEPSIGLHPRDNNRLLNMLKTLRDIGNSILVVEHDQETIESADYVIDLGPGAGRYGGEVAFAGTPEELLKAEESPTGKYLSGKKEKHDLAKSDRFSLSKRFSKFDISLWRCKTSVAAYSF